jgi:hypothetical protein
VVHVEGTTRPGSPNEPEYIKADVYFPDHMVREEPYTSKVVSDIVQQFIRNIGIPTIERFNRCIKLLWNLPLYSGPIPAPYPLQPTSPIASPPGSSVFCFYGNLKQNQTIVVDSDSDDDKPHFMTENTALRTQLMQVHQSIKRAEDVWANYNRREQPLAHSSNSSGSSSQPPPMTPANLQVRTVQIPHNPERTLLSHSSSQSSKTPKRTPSRHSISLSACGAGSRLPVTPKRTSPENQYTAFVDENDLTDFLPAIDLVRRRVVMFNWKDELLNLGIEQDLVADLMSAMNSYSETECLFSPSPL